MIFDADNKFYNVMVYFDAFVYGIRVIGNRYNNVVGYVKYVSTTVDYRRSRWLYR